MTQLEALQKKFINLRFGTFIHFNSATFQFHNNPDIIEWRNFADREKIRSKW